MTAPPTPPAGRSYALLAWLGGLVAMALAVGLGYWLVGVPVLAPPGPPGGAPPDDLPAVPAGPPWFRDVTAGSGLDFTYKNGADANQFAILETLGGGVALLDYDRDGLLDVFLPGGGDFTGPDRQTIAGRPCKLFRNRGGFRFEDATKAVGLDAVAWWYAHGAAVADYDRDGWPDLLVTGYGKLALFRNTAQGTGRRFVDVTADVGLRDNAWSTSAGWGDLDGDGWPDLYVCHYLDWSWANNPVCPGVRAGIGRDVCPPQKFKPLVHAVFRNDGGKRFSDETAAQGFKAAGCGLGVVLVDVNEDGKPDLYVGNDASNNFLYLNRSTGKLALEEKGLAAGVAVNEGGTYDGSMGVDAADYDGSGRASLWVTNFQGDLHGLYANRGGERFEHRSRAAGVGGIGMHWVGFGTTFLDIENDGWEDLVVLNGHVLQHPIRGSTFEQRPVLLRNLDYKGRRFFQDASSRGGDYFKKPALGRGLAVGDLDNDGRPDLVASHSNTPVAVLRNEAGEGSSWLGVELVSRDRRDVVGSTVTVETRDGRKLTRFVKGGGSYLSANDPRLLFGLGPNGMVKRVTVRWSWGKAQEWDWGKTSFDEYWQFSEGVEEAKPVTEP